MPADGPIHDVWGARLPGGLDPRARSLNDSLRVDRRLWPEELHLSRAYAQSLAECGVLTEAECRELLAACDRLEEDLASGKQILTGEDVHGAVEAELVRRAGDAGRRLHTGRSRNDQVSTLFRLRVMRLCEEAIESVRELERALVSQARRAGDVAVGATTHLQPAQPVLLAHFWLAHVSALERDEVRFVAARQAASVLPLGAGAIAGTPLAYDRQVLALRLGFDRTSDNSIDAVGDRDFALDYLNAAAVLGLHVSRLAEDLVLGCSPLLGWFRAPQGFATGSSLLPQKRNPDVFELARAKSAALLANVQRLSVVLKGLPSGYQKDLQEDKEAVFHTADALEVLLRALTPAVEKLEVLPAGARASLTPDLLAVELADSLVEEGVPFREAHGLVGSLWAAAERAGVEPAALPEEARLAISSHFTAERLGALTVESAIARRDHPPGTGPASVARQLARAEGRLGLGPGLAEESSMSGEATDSPPPAIAERPAPVGTEAPRAAPSEVIARNGYALRRARVEDVPDLAQLMSSYVREGLLLARPVGELYQSVREFWLAEAGGEVVACAALRILWNDLGEVRSLAVRPDFHGRGIGAALVDALIADARGLGLPLVIALTKEVKFFERCGFRPVSRERLPRKVWTDCVQCPKRHACDEIGVVLELVPGGAARASLGARPSVLLEPVAPLPQTVASA
jgi:argininosuccinate lyase